VRGDLRREVGKPERAEADFREAIDLAQHANAKTLELRAATSLAIASQLAPCSVRFTAGSQKASIR
jgi:predicted RNA polymerase sigma factor